jgi:hypothetical protein
MTEKDYLYFYNEFFKLHEILSHKDKKVPSLEECIEISNIQGDVYNPFQWITDYINFNRNIIDDFSKINPDWTEEYYKSRIEHPDQPNKFPEIYIKFNKLITAVQNEDYQTASDLKKEILDY